MKKYVVVLHYRTIEKTCECVESVLKSTSLYSILIVDNCSNDGTLEKLHAYYDANESVEFLELSENIGFARANNAAVKKLLSAGVNYAILSNNDIVFSNGAIDNLFSGLEEREDAVIVAPKVLNPSGEIQNTVQRKRNKVFSYLLGNFVPIKSENFAKISSGICEIAQFSGCCFACNLINMEKVGFFDDYTFLYFEEPILAEKIYKKGLKIIYNPNACVVHYHGASTKSINYGIFYYMLDSEIYYLSKYLKVNRFILSSYCRLKRLSHMKKYADNGLYEKETVILNRIKSGAYEKS